jgi:hypothetical protein
MTEGTPILYGRKRLQLIVDLDADERMGRQREHADYTRGGAYLAWPPRFRVLRLCVRRLLSLADCTVRNALLRHCCGLKTFLSALGHYIDKFLGNVVCLAVL